VGGVHLQVLMARGLPPANLSGRADPYCSVLCGSEENQSTAVFDTLEPRWSEAFVFANRDVTDETWPSNQRVLITVKNSNKSLPDDRLGQVLGMPLACAAAGPVMHAIQPLPHSRPTGHSIGDVSRRHGSGAPGMQVEVSLARFTGSPAPQWIDLQRPGGSIAEKGRSCGQVCMAMWHGPELEPQMQGADHRVKRNVNLGLRTIYRHSDLYCHDARPWTAAIGVDSRVPSGRMQAAAQRDTQPGTQPALEPKHIVADCCL
jgi:C2 domain